MADSVTVTAVPCKGRDLRAGDIFTTDVYLAENASRPGLARDDWPILLRSAWPHHGYKDDDTFYRLTIHRPNDPVKMMAEALERALKVIAGLEGQQAMPDDSHRPDVAFVEAALQAWKESL